jgi:hypothetical protein
VEVILITCDSFFKRLNLWKRHYAVSISVVGKFYINFWLTRRTILYLIFYHWMERCQITFRFGWKKKIIVSIPNRLEMVVKKLKEKIDLVLLQFVFLLKCTVFTVIVVPSLGFTNSNKFTA